jgi:hypothetical protein
MVFVTPKAANEAALRLTGVAAATEDRWPFRAAPSIARRIARQQSKAHKAGHWANVGLGISSFASGE